MPHADLAQPLVLAHGPVWKNRIALAPLTNRQSHADGTLSDDECRWLTMRAEGGFGMTMTAAAHVQRAGQGFGGQLGIFSEDHIPGLARLAAAIRAAGSVSAVQLYHAGSRADKSLVSQPVAPSDDPETGSRALTEPEVERLRDDFIAAACRAARAGFDGVELHGAHGFIFTQFLAATTNRRTDAYGGALENRARLLNEVLAGIRRACPASFQIGLRLSPDKFGLKLTEMRDLAAESMRAGAIDYLDLSLFDTFRTSDEAPAAGKTVLSVFTVLPRGKARLGATGAISSATAAARALDEGCDFVMTGKAAILEHDFANRLLCDPRARAREMPVTPEYLASQGVTPPFVGYLRSFPGIVA